MNYLFNITAVIFLLSTTPISAGTIYQAPDSFLKETFSGNLPEPQVIWIRKSMRDDIRDIMGHDLNLLRVRFWAKNDRIAYILDEIGKEKPITVGLVIENGKLELVKILIFRESRGWEVRYPFFTDQFRGADLDSTFNLDRRVNGISGATLSVRAVTRLARLALYLSDFCRPSPVDSK